MINQSSDDPLARAVATGRTLLFAPGDRPERFGKALSSGSDVVVVDLEDGVPLARKGEARTNVLDLLGSGSQVVVRVNDSRTPEGVQDLRALGSLSGRLVVMLPKSEDPAQVQTAIGLLPVGSSVVALIETAVGVINAERISGTSGVVRLAFGHLDLCAQLGILPANDVALSPARFAIVAASAIHGLPAPVDGVCPEFRDTDAVRRDARASLSAGFTAKLCIHPAQVSAVHLAFAPDDDELAWARMVVQSLSLDGVAQLNGQMVDRPVLLRAQALLARARPG